MYNYRKLFHKSLKTTALQLFDPFKPVNHNVFMRREVVSCNRIHNLKQYSTLQSKTRSMKPVLKDISNFEDLKEYILNQRRVDMKYLSEVLDSSIYENLTENNVIFLLECCSRAIPGETFKTKHAVCQMIFRKFQSKLKYSKEFYKTYINVCTSNKQVLHVESLISLMGSDIDFDTMKLLLKNVCEQGDTVKSLKLIVELKDRGYPADEEVFTDLVLCHTIQGGLKAGLSVLQTMHKAKFNESEETNFSLIKGVARRKDKNQFVEALEKFPIRYTEEHVLKLLNSLGFAENYGWIKYMKKLKVELYSREFHNGLEELCINLVHNSLYDSAIEITKQFAAPKVDGTFGSIILREMLICSAPIEKIVEFSEDLKQTGLNSYALEYVTDLALKYKLTLSAMRLFKYFETLRPHYFWPILVRAKISQGELGIMEVVQKAHEMNVLFDDESFQSYIFPYCDLRDPKRVIENFRKFGYTVKNLLTPMLVVLLRRKVTQLALNTCNSYEVEIGSEDLINNLPYTWIGTVDHDVCLTLIQKMSESMNKLLLGNFLLEIINKLHSSGRLRHFSTLLQDAKRRALTIDSVTAESILSIVRNSFTSHEDLPEIENSVLALLDMTRISNFPQVPHPAEMDTDQLECHLIELKSKNMETRGVIRKLLQKHSSEGNLERVKELEEEVSSNKYALSPGMRTNLMHSHVKKGDVRIALKCYDEVKNFSPNFQIDAFKLVDLAKLLVENNNFSKAVEILTNEANERKMDGNKGTERNCKELLSSIKNMEQQKVMFDLLIDKGYCDPANIVLGSLMQLHLEKDTLKNTVDLFIELSHKYRKTPMQIVVLGAAIDSGDQELLNKVLDTISTVYGNVTAHCSLISALCEKGYTKHIVGLLQDTQLNPCKEMELRCERWIKLNSLKPLETLLEVSRKVSPKLLNIPKIELSIMQLYSKNNDCEGALEFWKKLVDTNDYVSTEVDMEFCNLLDRCKYDLPDDLELKYRVK